MTQPQQQLQPHHSLKLQNNGMNRLSRVFLIPLTTLVCTKILILSLFMNSTLTNFNGARIIIKKEAGNLRDNRPLIVSEMRFELTRANAHYPLKVACLPISPPGHCSPESTFGSANIGTICEFAKFLRKKRQNLHGDRPGRSAAVPECFI